jgi:hypothetical protein
MGDAMDILTIRVVLGTQPLVSMQQNNGPDLPATAAQVYEALGRYLPKGHQEWDWVGFEGEVVATTEKGLKLKQAKGHKAGWVARQMVTDGGAKMVGDAGMFTVRYKALKRALLA